MSLKYRPEVDGLRCIAVMLVILHHLNLPGFSGGFVGVDVFFVISGYLITGIVLAEVKSDGFTFGSFYKRRVIRLAPAYFTVLLVTAVLAWLLMLPAELENFSVSALYSTFFVANFYMWDAVGGYFGAGADTTPLLHLWSLAVEEQFYVVWPVTLLLLYKLLGGGRYLFAAVLVALMLGLVVSEYSAVNSRAAAYYLMPTRAFELLTGAALVFLPLSLRNRVPGLVRVVLGLVGLGLILYGSVFFTGDTWFPGLNALFPCVGTALLIAFTRADDPLLGKLLASKPAVGIGKISYPAYLWHWPIIAFLNLQLVELTPLVCIAVIAGTLMLAALTYHFVEKPVREFRRVRWPRVVGAGFALPAVLFSSAALSAIHWQGMPERFDEELNRKSAAVLTYAYEVRGRCNEGPVKSPLGPDKCVLGIEKRGVDILLVGDSHANHFSGMISVLADDAGLRGYDVTQSNTAFLVGVERFYRQREQVVHHSNFSQRNALIEQKLLPDRYDYVVLGGSFVGHYNDGLFSTDLIAPEAPTPEIFRKAMVRTITEIIGYGSTPVLIKGNPTFEFDVSSCTLNNDRFGFDKNCHLERDDYDEKFREWSQFVEALQEQFPQLMVIDPAKVMCDERKCYSELDGVPLYKDGGHLNYEGSKLIGELYIDRFDNPFASATSR
jgi:peptidoglycan/LPS O-acetylase OafA/YrhL